MTSYTDVFGGNSINPTLLDYYAASISANQALVWLIDGQSVGTNELPAASKLDLTPTVGSLVITLPDARLVSVGQDILFRNLGAVSYSVVDNDGGAVATVAAGTAWFVNLKTNANNEGTWYAIQFGAGSSSADAAALAGLGLVAITTTLNQSHPYEGISSTPYSVVAADRAQALVWTGGAGTFNLTAAATLGSTWFTLIKNLGSGTLTIDPAGADTVDGAATLSLDPDESLFLLSDGVSGFYTVGRGRSVLSSVTAINVALPGTGTYIMSAIEVAAQVITFTGTLTGASIAQFGTGAGFWIVRNATTGAFDLTCETNGADPGVVVVQGTTTFIFSDGTNMYWADDQLATTGLIARTGTAARAARTITGTANEITVTNGSGVAGNPTLSLPSAVIAPGSVTVTTNLVVTGTSTFNGNTTIGDNSADAHILLGTITAGTASVILLDDSVTTAGSPPLAFDGDANTGIFRAAADTLAFATGGTERARFDSSGRLLLAGATVATGYTTAGDVTLPATGAIRAKNTAKAWINLNMNSATTRDDFNCDACTDNGAGDFTINFTNAMADANYTVVAIASGDNATDNGFPKVLTTGGKTSFSAYSTTQCRIVTQTIEPSIANADELYFGAIFFGA